MSIKSTETEGEGEELVRDNARFKYLHPNGKPELPEGFSVVISKGSTYKRAFESKS